MRKISKTFPIKPASVYMVQSFFAVWALLRAGHMTTRSIFTPVLFLLCVFFFRFVSERRRDEAAIPPGASFCGVKRIRCLSLIMGAFFTLLYLLAESGALTDGLSSRLFQAIVLAACGIGVFLLFYHVLLLLLLKSARFSLNEERAILRFLPLLSFIICLLCWLPYFLYEYPAIMSPDSINQFEQVIGMAPYSNHHPWVHTLLIGLLYRFGRLFTSDANAALSFFTVFQMCFMAAAVSRLISTLQKFRIRNSLCLLVTAFYALVPYHGVLAVTIWKDVLFSGAVLLFTTALLSLLFLSPLLKAAENAVSLAVYTLAAVMVCLFRSNGWYAFLFSLPFLLYAFRKKLRFMLPLHVGILAIVLLIKGPVMTSCHVTQPDFVESICIPLQQVARVICEDKPLTEEEWESVHKVLDTTYIKDLYAPGFADNMKELVRAGHPGYLEDHKGDYLKLWLSLGLRYPYVYLQAYIGQTIGYWYPDTDYTVADIDGVIANETGLYSRPLIGGPFLVKAKEILLKLGDMLPLYGLLSSMGAMFWAFLCCMAITFAKKQPGKYVVFLPGLAVILTLLIATPVSSEFRYAYSLAYALPLYLLLPFLKAPSQ